MRVLCAYSRDQNLCDAFNNGKDLHCLTGSGISSFTYDQIKANKDDENSPEYMARQVAKKVNFGTIYCMSALALKEQLWYEMHIEVTEEEAQAYLDGFFVTYPGVKEYIRSTEGFTRRFQFIHTFTGRRRRFPIMEYSAGKGMNRILRQAVNTRIQATSSDIVITNLVHLNKWVKQNGGRTLLTVHDSDVFQLPKSMRGVSVRAELDRLIVHDTKRFFPWLPVPWAYDVGRGPTYGHDKEKVD